MWILFNGKTRLKITLKKFSFDRSIVWRMVRVGIPASLSGIHMNIGNMVFIWFIDNFVAVALTGQTDYHGGR